VEVGKAAADDGDDGEAAADDGGGDDYDDDGDDDDDDDDDARWRRRHYGTFETPEEDSDLRVTGSNSATNQSVESPSVSGFRNLPSYVEPDSLLPDRFTRQHHWNYAEQDKSKPHHAKLLL
jgi:hypothetical protein